MLSELWLIGNYLLNGQQYAHADLQEKAAAAGLKLLEKYNEFEDPESGQKGPAVMMKKVAEDFAGVLRLPPSPRPELRLFTDIEDQAGTQEDFMTGLIPFLLMAGEAGIVQLQVQSIRILPACIAIAAECSVHA